jgi:carbamoylphosphate synthase large subunit
MAAYKVLSVVFDLEDSLESDFVDDNGDIITEDSLQKSLQQKVIGEVFVVDEDEDVVDKISDKYGWCVSSSTVEQIPSAEYHIYGMSNGESNDRYRTGEIPIIGKTTDLAVIRAIKKEIGWNNIRCRTENHGTFLEIYPSGLLQKCYIKPHYE